ncbi:hypothetical protein ACFWYW_15965 [Nonomuraea sp. NPDC059023]|uniref:hypothetical protein n=1 Tax=unclassified Nonomuraea TaxID=2593643 RepID=UPI0036BE7665
MTGEVRVYNVVRTAAQIQADTNTPVAAAATTTAGRRQGTDAVATIERLTVKNSRPVDGDARLNAVCGLHAEAAHCAIGTYGE